MLTDEQINDQYRKILGRSASESELADFKRFGDTGFIDLSSEDVGSILQGIPEQRQKQLGQYTTDLGKQLAGGDTTALNRAGDLLTQRFAMQGRGTDSSAYVNAFAGAARDLALQRQQTMANFYGGGLQNIFGETGQRALGARQLGLTSLGTGKTRQFGLEDVARQRGFQTSDIAQQRGFYLEDSARQRQQQLEDYERQKNFYMHALERQSQLNRNQSRGGAFGSLLGSIGGGALGFGMSGGNPMGALQGAQFGSGLGGLFGNAYS